MVKIYVLAVILGVFACVKMPAQSATVLDALYYDVDATSLN